MTLAIAVGSKSVSSKCLEIQDTLLCGQEEFFDDEDGKLLYPTLSEPQQPLVALAQSADQELRAIVTISYFDLMRDARDAASPKRSSSPFRSTSPFRSISPFRSAVLSPPARPAKAYSIAQVSIQIVPSTDHFSSASSLKQKYRTTAHLIRMPLNDQEGRQRKEKQQQQQQSNESEPGTPLRTEKKEDNKKKMSVIFSHDNRFLSCLIPHPEEEAPAVLIIFQLRRPKHQTAVAPAAPPLPAYIKELSSPTPEPGLSSGGGNRSDSGATGTGLATSGQFKANSRLSAIPVATNPSVFTYNSTCRSACTSGDGLVFTAIEDMSACPPEFIKGAVGGSPSFLVAGCADGRLVAITYRPPQIAACLHSPAHKAKKKSENGVKSQQSTSTETIRTATSSSSSTDGNHTETGDDGKEIIELRHMTTTTSVLGGARGKLVAIYRNGQAKIFSTRVTSETEYLYEKEKEKDDATVSTTKSEGEATTDLNETFSFDFSQQQKQRASANKTQHSFTISVNKVTTSFLMAVTESLMLLQGPFCCAEWISGSFLALMKEEQNNSRVSVQVWGLSDRGAAPLSTWEIDEHRLKEYAISNFSLEEPQHQSFTSGNTADSETCCSDKFLQYDAFSDCLAISAVLKKKVESASPASAHPPKTFASLPFVCVWSWRSNVEGLLLGSTEATFSPVTISRLWFCKNDLNQRKLVHSVLLGSVGQNKSHKFHPKIRLEMYDAAALSIAAERSVGTTSVRPPNNLLVTSKSVSYPSVNDCSSKKDYEMEWTESSIPTDYLASHGAPCLAAIGLKHGRSIAVASERGLCALECPCDAVAISDSNGSHRAKGRFPGVRGQSRWRRFGTPTEEASFSVVSMTWWEGDHNLANDPSYVCDDDILVAIIEVKEKRKTTRYISCWSKRALDLDHQLVTSLPGSCTTASWGLSIGKFPARRLSLLDQPVRTSRSNVDPQRKAVLLLTSDDDTTKFLIIQLQVSSNHWRPTSYRDPLPFEVHAQLAAFNEIGSPAEIFLAGASYAFDLSLKVDPEEELTESEYVATIGIFRTPGNGIDAISISGSTIVAIGQVVEPSDCLLDCTVVRYSQTDFVRGRPLGEGTGKVYVDCFVWLLQLSNGSLFCWSVPYVQSLAAWEQLLRPSHRQQVSFEQPTFVHSTSMILGDVAPAGTTSIWMQLPSMSVKRNFDLGNVPASSFGCTLSSGQSCKKLHRSLCEEFERELFRPDFLEHEFFCPSELDLSLPAFIPSYYALMLDTVRVKDEDKDHSVKMDCAFKHLQHRLRTSAYEDTSMLSLQLLVLRVVESITNAREQKPRFEHYQRMFRSMVDAIRRNTTNLQFAALFLECGRAIEPSSLQHLFPLPPPMGTAWKEGESVNDLYRLSLQNGSVSTAIAALPLFDDGEKMRSLCAEVFRHCLDVVTKSLEIDDSINLQTEEVDTMRDIFRYALKLEDSIEASNAENLAEESSGSEKPDEEEEENETGAEINGNDSEESEPEQGGLMFFCIGARRSSQNLDDCYENNNGKGENYKVEREEKKNSTKTEHKMNGYSNGAAGLQPDSKEVQIDSVADILANHLISAVFGSKSYLSKSNWKWATILAILLSSGEGASGLPRCSQACMKDIVLPLTSRDVISLISAASPKKASLAKFFEILINQCKAELDGESANMLLDLVLILLDRHDVCGDLKAETPGLVAIAFVTSQIAGRSSEVFDDAELDGHVLYSAFQIAKSHDDKRNA